MNENTPFGPKSLGDIIENLISQKGWDDSVIIEKLPSVWKETVGEKFDSISEIRNFEGGKLFIFTSSSVWKSELLLRKEKIIKNLNASLGKNVVKQLIFL